MSSADPSSTDRRRERRGAESSDSASSPVRPSPRPTAVDSLKLFPTETRPDNAPLAIEGGRPAASPEAVRLAPLLEAVRRAPSRSASPMARFVSRATSRDVPNWLAVVLTMAIGAQLWMLVPRLTSGAAGDNGTIVVESNPVGAQVRMDSRPIGVTPLQVSAPTGDRILEVEYNRSARRLPVTVRRGEIVRQRVEFIVDAPAAAAPVLGAIAVASDGGRAPVLVDGTARGLSPVVVSDLQPGDHTVTVMFPTGKIERTIRVDGGATASLAVTMPPAPRAVSGWLQVDVKERLQIIEDGKLIGTTEFERLMLPAGHHTLDLTNPELGFSTRRDVTITAGETNIVRVDLPVVPLAINAQPWADVWLDGRSVGATPIGALPTPIGRHDLVFRHPQLGERRSSVVVTLERPARVGIDLRRNE